MQLAHQWEDTHAPPRTFPQHTPRSTPGFVEPAICVGVGALKQEADREQVQEMELSVTPKALQTLLNFLRYSFGGGTDVDRPLELALQRLQDENWNQVSA